MKYLFIILPFLLVPDVYGHQAVCEVWHEVNGKIFPKPASGVFIADDGEALIATCRHPIINGGESVIVAVRFEDGVDRRVTNYYYDSIGWDIAIVSVASLPSSIVPIPIAEDIPKVGDSVVMHAFAPRQPKHGKVVGYARQIRSEAVQYMPPEPAQELQMDFASGSGDSGSPILNSDGEIVAILSSSDRQTFTIGPYNKPLMEFVNRVFERRAPEVPMREPDLIPDKPNFGILD